MMPVAGSTEKVTIFSGVLCATSSILTPPSVERHFGGFAVDQDREIKLLVDIGAVFDVEAVDLLAMRPGLYRHQRRTQHLLGELVDLGDRLGDSHAAFAPRGGFLEGALAAATRMNLAFDHPDRAGKGLGGGVGIGGPEHRHALGDRHPELVQQRLGLVFMDIHCRRSPRILPLTSSRGTRFWTGIPYTTLSANLKSNVISSRWT
jgi:hypothetical protein